MAILFSRANLLCDFGKERYEEHFCEIFLNFAKRFIRRCLKRYFLSGALAAFLFSRVKPFVQF